MSDADSMLIHFNALVHGLKSHLLPAAKLEEMLAQGDVTRLTEMMLDTSYRKEMAEALTRAHGADAVEEAVHRSRAAMFNTLARRAQGDFGQLVAIFLARLDLAAVKYLIRSKHHGLAEEEILAGSRPGVSMSLPQFQEFARSESMEELINKLVSWNTQLCKPLRAALPAYRDKNDPALLEDAIDFEYFSKSARALKNNEDDNAKALASYLSEEIDRMNLRTIFEHHTWSKDKEGLLQRLIPGGTLPQSTIEAMANALDAAAAIEFLAGTRYQSLTEELVQYLQTHRFAPVERYFDRLIDHQLHRLALRDPFGIGVVMHFVWLKFNEGVNLRLIARGLGGSVPLGRVREELYLQN